MSNKEAVVLNVEGMSCGSCVKHVDAALRGVDGVEAVEVSLSDGTVRVTRDPSRATIAAMTTAIEAAGYTARGPA